MRNLSITERRKNNIIILDLDGNIRIGEGSVEFRHLIRQFIENGEKNILLNLAGISYIDSSGLGELVAGFNALRKIGGELKLLHLTRRVNELMVITKLATVFDVHNNEAEALNSFTPASDIPENLQASIVTGKLDIDQKPSQHEQIEKAAKAVSAIS